MKGKTYFPTRAREAYRRMLDEVRALSAIEKEEALALARIDTWVNQFIGVDVEELRRELIGLYKEGQTQRL